MNDTQTNEERLRSEIEDLRRQLEQQRKLIGQARAQSSGPTFRTLLVVLLLLATLGAAGYYYGYAPRQRRPLLSGYLPDFPADMIPEVFRRNTRSGHR